MDDDGFDGMDSVEQVLTEWAGDGVARKVARNLRDLRNLMVASYRRLGDVPEILDLMRNNPWKFEDEFMRLGLCKLCARLHLYREPVVRHRQDFLRNGGMPLVFELMSKHPDKEFIQKLGYDWLETGLYAMGHTEAASLDCNARKHMTNTLIALLPRLNHSPNNGLSQQKQAAMQQQVVAGYFTPHIVPAGGMSELFRILMLQQLSNRSWTLVLFHTLTILNQLLDHGDDSRYGVLEYARDHRVQWRRILDQLIALFPSNSTQHRDTRSQAKRILQLTTSSAMVAAKKP